jgi:hypothetical protein
MEQVKTSVVTTNDEIRSLILHSMTKLGGPNNYQNEYFGETTGTQIKAESLGCYKSAVYQIFKNK